MGTIGVNVLTNSSGNQSVQLSFGNVTFTASGSFITGYGYYADGLPYVVSPVGHLTFSSITPAQSTAPDGTVINGASKNLEVRESQPFDERFYGYGATKQVDANTKFYAGDICVKLVSRNTDQNAAWFTSTEQRKGIGEYAACFVVSSAPAANTMSPAPIGWPDRGTPTAHVLTDTLDNITASLHGTYTSSGQDTVSAPSHKYAAPGLALARGGMVDYEYRRYAPYGYYGGQYGRDIARGQAYLTLGILTDAWTEAQAKAAIIHLIQTGIALYDSGVGMGAPQYGYDSAAPEGNGGHLQYALTPVLFALKYTGRTAAIDTTLRDKIPTNELWQPFAVTAAIASQAYTEHDSASQMDVSRSRQITNIVGNVITLEEHAADTLRITLSGHQMVLSGTPTVRTTVLGGANGTGEIATGGNRDITVTDATGFSILNDVYFTPTWAIQEGDHEWNINDPADYNSFQGTEYAHSYLAIQIWYAALVTVRALGLYDASVFGAFEQYCLRSMRPNQPSDTRDRNSTSWATSQGIDGHLHASSWTRAFHEAHAATIFPDWTAAAPTLSSSSPTDNATGVAVGANITLTFNESVRFGYGTITLRENNGGWADLEVFDIANPAGFGTGAGQISISGSTLTINPTADLTASREYAIQVGSGAITNLKYVPYAGIADDTTLSFTTA